MLNMFDERVLNGVGKFHEVAAEPVQEKHQKHSKDSGVISDESILNLTDEREGHNSLTYSLDYTQVSCHMKTGFRLKNNLSDEDVLNCHRGVSYVRFY